MRRIPRCVEIPAGQLGRSRMTIKTLPAAALYTCGELIVEELRSTSERPGWAKLYAALASDLTGYAGTRTVYPFLPACGRCSYRYRNAYAALSLHERSCQPKRREWRHAGSRVQRQLEGGILDEITQMRIFIVADVCFHGDRPLAIFSTLRIYLPHQHPFSQLFQALASRPISCSTWREIRLSLLMVSIICTGIRMVCAPDRR